MILQIIALCLATNRYDNIHVRGNMGQNDSQIKRPFWKSSPIHETLGHDTRQAGGLAYHTLFQNRKNYKIQKKNCIVRIHMHSHE